MNMIGNKKQKQNRLQINKREQHVKIEREKYNQKRNVKSN